MVIQRWQSVWLLVASICVLLFCFLPIAIVSFDAPLSEEAANSATMLTVANNLVLLIVGIVIAILLFINIFSFKNTKLQKRMTILSILLIAVLACCTVFMVYNGTAEGAHIEWLGSILLLLGAVAFAILAYRGIRHDEKLLRAADRLR